MLTEQQKTGLLLTLFMGAVCLVVIAYFHFMLGRGMIKNYDQRTEQMSQDLAKQEGKLREIDRLLAQKEELDKRSEAIRKVKSRLPSQVEAPGFLDALRGTLRMTGIIHEDILSEKAERSRLDSTLSKFKNERLKKLFENRTSCSLYTEIPYVILAHGRYHAVGQFLTLVEQNPQRFMRVKYLKIKNDLVRPSIHTIQMVVETFMFKSANTPEKSNA